MSTVRLELPVGVADGLDLQTARDWGSVAAVIEGVDVVANVVTLTSLAPHLRALAQNIRAWAGGRPGAPPTVLTIRGKGIDVRVELDPNVPTAKILRALERLTAEQ